METAALVVLGVALAVCVGTWLVIGRMRGELRLLRERADQVARRVDALPADLSKVFGNQDRLVVSVELLNVFELAHRETWVARPLSVLTPRLLRDVIHRTLVGRVRDSLAEAGVQADVRLHRVR